MLMQVMIRGKLYPSVRDAAKALRVAPATVYCGIVRGSIDRIGLGPDYKARRHGGGMRTPITVAGQRFNSIADLARAIGRDPKCVRQSLKAGDQARQGVVTAVMRMVADKENAAFRAAMRRE